MTMVLVNPKNGAKLETYLSDKEAAEVCIKLTSDTFAMDLAVKYFESLKPGARGLSTAQFWWLHKKAMDAIEGKDLKVPPDKVDLGKFDNIVSIFGIATRFLKYPKVTFNDKGRVVQFAFTSRGKEPGSVVVTDSGGYGKANYYGRIHKDGTFSPSSKCTPEVLEYIKKFAANPAEMAAEYGKRSGVCCFCNKLLTDRSAEWGYGDVCAAHYGLPWIDCRTDKFKELKERA